MRVWSKEIRLQRQYLVFTGYPETVSSSANSCPANRSNTDRQSIFRLPFHDTEVEELIARLDTVLGHLDVNVFEIDAGWTRHIQKFECTKEGQSFDDTLRFIRQLKRHAIAIRTCGKYGLMNAVPGADRAVLKLSTTASSQVARLDSLKPEDGAVVWCNLQQFEIDCKKIIDDDEQLQADLLKVMSKPKADAMEWVARVECEIIKVSRECYAEARNLNVPDKCKEKLRKVINYMESHERLQEKLVALGLRANTSEDLPLVAQVKTQVSEEEASTVQHLSGECSIEKIAESIHAIYITATDLVHSTILAHAESCIEKILNAVERLKAKNKFGLQEPLGTVLSGDERDLPQGGQIVAEMPQFAEMNLLAFQEMIAGMMPKHTVGEVAKLQGLFEEEQDLLLKVVLQVYAKYDAILKKNIFRELPVIVANIKKDYEQSRNSGLSDLIGGIFAIWSLQSLTEHCLTFRRPIPVQIVAIVRLLVLDKPPPRGLNRLQSWFRSSSKHIDASHFAQIKTGQGKSVILGVLATVLSIAGFK